MRNTKKYFNLSALRQYFTSYHYEFYSVDVVPQENVLATE